ncbi:MAG: hypothetical protein IPM55_09235 [Acidobacteria bacterium]|nr:hypothetical protein [Acidobacteriota bacterium]
MKPSGRNGAARCAMAYRPRPDCSQWPEKGPAVAWSISNLGKATAHWPSKRIAFMCKGNAGAANDAKSTVFCLNRADGKTIWSVTLGRKSIRTRATAAWHPTLDGDKLLC